MKSKILQPVSLHGIWRFKLDENDQGVDNKWYLQELENTITLPGTLQAQGYGNEISADTPFVDGLHDTLWFLREEYKEFTQPGNTKVPFLTQPVRHYTGAAWYQTDIVIPAEWVSKRIELHLERTRWKTAVWVDDINYGDYDSLCAEHVFELGILTPGKHTLTIRVDNSMIYPYRPDAHAVSDSQGNTWNGIAGKIELVPTSLIWIDDITVYPDYTSKSAKVKISVRNTSGSAQACNININKTINLNCNDNSKFPKATDSMVFHADVDLEGGNFEYSLILGENASLWDEFNPALHNIDVTLAAGTDNEVFDEKSVTFGLRNITTHERNFVLNGKIIKFRGTNDAGCTPLTGYPPTDAAEWKRIMSICKNWGMNHIRYHSWCPPEAAFIAADELGIYLQIEPGMWNYFTPGGIIEHQLHVETERVLKAYGNHPSFLLMSASNEPHGNYLPCLKAWVAKYKSLDSRRLYCVESGWFWPKDGEPLDGTDYFYTSSHGVGRMRGSHGWFGKDYSKYFEGMVAPFISHEVGQNCAYPDFSIIDKFTGYLRPGNYEIFKSSLAKHKMLHKNKDFAYASGVFQAASYKEEIEANLRTHEYSGFSLLDLHDYIGQGGALVGMLDVFWNRKGYITAEQFRRFCSPVVPLARVCKSVYTTCETFQAELEFACYAAEDLTGAVIYWKIVDDSGKIFIENKFDRQDIKTGQNTQIGRIEADLSCLGAPSSYKLVVGVENTDIENDWKIWVYPEKADFTEFKNVNITKSFNEAVDLLKAGKNVLFLPASESLDFNCPPISKVPTFWNNQMGPKWSRGLGLWCDTSHKALSEFPASCAMEWQWNEILQNARGMNIEALPDEVQPFIWPIDDWNRNYKLALAFECNVYNGKLMVCSADLENNLDTRPAARQLLYSIMKYMDSDYFSPVVEVAEQQLKSFLFDTTIMKRLNAKARIVGSEEEKVEVNISEDPGRRRIPKLPIENVIDGDPNTYWLAGGVYGGEYPFEVEIEVENPVWVNGISIMPRQNHRDFEGAVKKYEIYTSMSGDTWSQAGCGELPASFDLQRIYFENKVLLKKLRLKLIEGFGADNVFYWTRGGSTGFAPARKSFQDQCASLAEVAFICDEGAGDLLSNEIKIDYKNVRTATDEIY